MPPVVNRSHVGVLTPLYTGIHSENVTVQSRDNFGPF